MALTIFLPIALRQTGGTSTFARKLQAEMAQRGHQVFFTYQSQYDILLASPQCPPQYLVDAWWRRKPIVHRLDGVYYPATVAGWRYPFYNLPLKIIRNYLADAIIYQSEFSRRSCRDWLGPEPSAPTIVVHNGVDINLFSPDGTRAPLQEKPTQHVFITASRFRRRDQLEPILAAFAEYRKIHHADSILVIIGDIAPSLTALVSPPPAGVKLRGALPNAELPQYLRAADVFIFTHHNPPCPNNVLEALACGLPICGVASGAMPELVRSGQEGELLPVTTPPDRYHLHPIDPHALAEQMKNCVAQREQYGLAARERAVTDFSLTRMVDRYVEILNDARYGDR